MWEVITDLINEGTTVLLTTQYLEEADRLADNIIVVNHGRVIAEGTADQLKSQLGGERLEIRVADSTDLDLAERTMLEIAASAGQFDEEVQIDTVARSLCVPFATGARGLPDAVRQIDAAGLELTDLALRRPTLDDVFMTLTGHVAEEVTDTENAA
jgi:ABC-2 type transport system ATP-binding protein